MINGLTIRNVLGLGTLAFLILVTIPRVYSYFSPEPFPEVLEKFDGYNTINRFLTELESHRFEDGTGYELIRSSFANDFGYVREQDYLRELSKSFRGLYKTPHGDIELYLVFRISARSDGRIYYSPIIGCDAVDQYYACCPEVEGVEYNRSGEHCIHNYLALSSDAPPYIPVSEEEMQSAISRLSGATVESVVTNIKRLFPGDDIELTRVYMDGDNIVARLVVADASGELRFLPIGDEYYLSFHRDSSVLYVDLDHSQIIARLGVDE